MSDAAPRPRDDRARQRAQSEFVGPVVLEAGAGTGKTATLVARILSWSLGAGWARRSAAEEPPSDDETTARDLLGGIVAITFTEAAAAEMGTRVATELGKIARGAVDEVVGFDPTLLADGAERETLPARARALLANLDHLAVRTIHAFCRSLLATYPLEAGVHPSFAVDADGSRRRATLRAVIEDEILRSYAEEEPDALSRLAAAGVGPGQLFEALDLLLQEGADPRLFARDPFDDAGVSALRREVRAAAEALMETGGESLRATSARSKATATAIAAAGATLTLTGPAGLREADRDAPPESLSVTQLIAALQEAWSDAALKRLDAWRRPALNASESAAFAGEPAAFGDAARNLRGLLHTLQRIDVPRFRDARAAVARLLERTETELRADGIATFASLLRDAERLLTEQPAVLRRERRRIDQLLVDEFQDTDPRQCEIVRRLALDGPADQRPGLFVVGDPKQSIYGWRDADLEAYERFARRIVEAGGERHALTTNFRSTPAILAEVERVMRPAMRAVAGLQPAYEPLVAYREETSRFPAVEYWVSWSEPPASRSRGRSDDVARLEAESVARDIIRYRSESAAAWSDCAVLYRGRGQLDVFQDALRAHGIPYAVSRDVGYYRRREVIDAAALVRAVLSRTDHLALLTFLRSSVVGVPDAALLPLWQRRLPQLVTQLEGPQDPALERLRQLADEVAGELPQDVPGLDRIAGWQRNLVAAFELLAAGREAFRTQPADRFVETLRRRSLLDATEAARHQGEYRVANLERFFRQLERALNDPRQDVDSVLHALRLSVHIQPDTEEAKPQGTDEDAVQLMTFHVAKGLEFRSVWVIQLHTQSVGERLQPAARFEPRDPVDTERPAYELFGWPTPFRHVAESRERQVERAERVRTLYVAMTRARERLVLTGRWETKPPPEHWLEAESQVRILQMRQPEPPALVELWEELAAKRHDRAERGEALWVFPALSDRSAGAETIDAGAKVASPAQIRREAAALAAARREAADRMERPRHRAASTHGELFPPSQTADDAGTAPTERAAALLVGTAVHRALEGWRFDGSSADELQRAREAARGALLSAPAPIRDRAERRLEALFRRFGEGSLLRRLHALGDHVVARELPLVAPAGADDPALEAVVGSIDLVYRDPESAAAWVVADYKTDPIDDAGSLSARSAVYRGQLQVYADAIAGALGLPSPPRCELWYLWADRIEVLPSD